MTSVFFVDVHPFSDFGLLQSARHTGHTVASIMSSTFVHNDVSQRRIPTEN